MTYSPRLSFALRSLQFFFDLFSGAHISFDALTPSLFSKPPLQLCDFDLDERDQSGKSNDEYAEFPNHEKRGVQKFIHKHSQRKKEIMRL